MFSIMEYKHQMDLVKAAVSLGLSSNVNKESIN